MFLKSARVENFKCIEDSGPFSLKPVTCLVGKNEAGKSALIEALYKLNPDVEEKGEFDDLLEYPRRKYSSYKERREREPANVLTTEWELDRDDLEALEQALGPDVLESNVVVISKGYDNESHYKIQVNELKMVENCLERSLLWRNELKPLQGVRTIAELIDKLESKQSLSDRHKAFLKTLKESFPNNDPEEKVISILNENLPIFIYFAEFFRMDGKVSMSDLAKQKNAGTLTMRQRIFIALLELVRTSPEDLNNIGKFEELKAELEAVSVRLSQEIFDYWSQNKYLEVEFDFAHARPEDPPPFNEGWVFHTRIENTRHRVSVSFDERSAGFTWFFSFLVWFSQLKSNYGERLIVLLDDPGLSLHARAQADLLRYIKEKLSPHYQVIYTTHSPFMIDPDDLPSSVRTVEDVVTEEGEIQGTKVGDKVLATDPDTIFPLQAALGYDITQTLFVGKHNLLVEGPSDLLYLKWFSRTLQEMGRESLDPRWIIVICGGIGKVGSFMRLFKSSDLHVAVFTDYHTGLKNKVRSLVELNLLRASHVFSADMFVDKNEADVEDLLGRGFYVSLVNECYSSDKFEELPEEKPEDAPDRVLLEVESHFKTLPIEFDHYAPAQFLTENVTKFRSVLSKHNDALERFERLFRELNALLPRL